LLLPLLTEALTIESDVNEEAEFLEDHASILSVIHDVQSQNIWLDGTLSVNLNFFSSTLITQLPFILLLAPIFCLLGIPPCVPSSRVQGL